MEIRIELPESVSFIIQELEKCGYEGYIVGGAVRDSILGKNPHDYDICTSATPNEILQVFPHEEIIPTGLQHGTVTVLIDKEPFEITTFRVDGKYSDGRRPDNVTFSNSILEDLKRRDFTINAMAYNPNTGLVDPFGGMSDIRKMVIKCVGMARERFKEDSLRILRAIRFSATLGFSISPDVVEEIHKQYKQLEKISIERINNEFCKIAVSKKFSFALFEYCDVFSLFIPELKNLIGFQQNNSYHVYDVFEHTICAIKMCGSEDLIVRLAVFFHDFGKPHSFDDGEDGIRYFKGHGKVSADLTDVIMKRLKFDNETRKNVVELVYYHDAVFEVGKKYIKRWLNKLGTEQFKRLLEVRKADIKAQNPKYEKERLEKVENIEYVLETVLGEQECFSLKDLAVNGKDLMNIGYKTGKELGNTLNILLQLVIDGKRSNEKEELLQEAKRRI